MKLYTVGPTELYERTKIVSGESLPYFRTDEFSKDILDIEQKILKFSNASKNSSALFLTCSGTGAMEATVLNLLDKNSKILVIVGGAFGERFYKICQLHSLNVDVLKLEFGEELTKKKLEKALEKDRYTNLLINADETSTGILYDMEMIGLECKKKNIILICDAISSFLVDDFKMKEWNINVAIYSSQKALALHPGLSIVILDEVAKKEIKKDKTFYFDFNEYLSNLERGQTPFTPAVGIIYQLKNQLEYIEKIGIENFKNKIKMLAKDFRNKIKNIDGLKILNEKYGSNAVTTLYLENAYVIYTILREKYQLTILPSGGNLKEKIVRVGHLGDLSLEDNDILINAIKEIMGDLK